VEATAQTPFPAAGGVAEIPTPYRGCTWGGWAPLSLRGAHRASTRSTSAGSTGYLSFQVSKPPSKAAALKPNLFSLRAARALVASFGQVQ
jgi:hypothetical protein